MKNLVTIVYAKEHNPHVTNFRNETRNTRSRIFTSLEEAKRFADTVEMLHAFDGIGKAVRF